MNLTRLPARAHQRELPHRRTDLSLNCRVLAGDSAPMLTEYIDFDLSDFVDFRSDYVDFDLYD